MFIEMTQCKTWKKRALNTETKQGIQLKLKKIQNIVCAKLKTTVEGVKTFHAKK